MKPLRELLRLPGGKSIPVNMFFYCSFEVTIFFWATSFLTEEKGMSTGQAAGMMTFFYGAQIAGRLAGGFIALRVSDWNVVRVGMIVSLVGSVALTTAPDIMLVPILILVGLSTGPTYSLVIHEVISLVGKGDAQGVIGVQVTAANIGNAVTPLITGIVAGVVGFWIFPYVMVLLIAVSITLKAVQDYRFKDRRVM